jgi:hypothetical protein
MPIEKLPASAPIRTEIEVCSTLLIALGKLQGEDKLSNAERFEIAALKFTVARAICINNRAQTS